MLDDRIISRIIDPPRDEHGRFKVRPKSDPSVAPSPREAHAAKWRGLGLAEHHIERLWRQGLRA